MDRKKGNRLDKEVGNFVVIDIETTGVLPGVCDIIELGALRVVNGVPQEPFQVLVHPSSPIDTFIEKLTGITNEMVADAPDICDALPLFLDYVGTSVVLGHNVHFDINFIYDNLMDTKGIPFDNDFVDTLVLARRIYPELRSHKLKTLVEYLGIYVEGYHRAIEDCYSTYQLYQRLLLDAKERGVNLSQGNSRRAYDLREITPSVADMDPSHPLFGKSCVFTGTLTGTTRKDAAQIVVDLGGVAENNVTKKTNYLILGDLQYATNIKGTKSNKMIKAEKLILGGQDLEIIPESLFWELVNFKS